MRFFHICAHPDRQLLAGVGGISLSTTPIVYTQFISTSDAKNPSIRSSPYNEAVPRYNNGSTWNGGNPWSPNVDWWFLIRSCRDTYRRYAAPANFPRAIANVETDWINGIHRLPPREFSESCRALRIIGEAFGTVGPFPRPNWGVDKCSSPHMRNVGRILEWFDLDLYLVPNQNEASYRQTVSNTLALVEAMGRAASECKPRIWGYKENSNRTQMLTASELRFVLRAWRDNGIMDGFVWHDGTEWTTRGSAADDSFRATLAWANQPDIASVFSEFR
jgi:hypothetical protein